MSPTETAMLNGYRDLQVTGADFSSPPNGIIFNRVIELENRGLLAVTDALRKHGASHKFRRKDRQNTNLKRIGDVLGPKQTENQN